MCVNDPEHFTSDCAVVCDGMLRAGTHLFCGHYHRNSLARYEGAGGSLEMVCVLC